MALPSVSEVQETVRRYGDCSVEAHKDSVRVTLHDSWQRPVCTYTFGRDGLHVHYDRPELMDSRAIELFRALAERR